MARDLGKIIAGWLDGSAHRKGYRGPRMAPAAMHELIDLHRTGHARTLRADVADMAAQCGYKVSQPENEVGYRIETPTP